jgi:hypothetical protein
MPRYFFHLATGDKTLVDELGEEFDLVEEARGHAITVARELSRHSRPDLAARYISVMDERGVVVFTMRCTTTTLSC